MKNCGTAQQFLDIAWRCRAAMIWLYVPRAKCLYRSVWIEGSTMQNLKAVKSALVRATVATAALSVLAFAMLAVAAPPASANPAIAKATGQPCTKCHTAPPALNDYGKKYKESQKK
jgi:hypothetical protein